MCCEKEKPEWQMTLNCNMLLFVSAVFFVVWGKSPQIQITFRRYNRVKSPKAEAVVPTPSRGSLLPTVQPPPPSPTAAFPLTFQTSRILGCCCKLPSDRTPLGLCFPCPSFPVKILPSVEGPTQTPSLPSSF